MGGGKRWTDAENALLLEMAQQGLSLDAIVKSGKFVGRTPQAIAKQMERLKLGFFVGQNKKSFVGQIGKAEIPGFEEILARYIDAFNKVCEKDEITKLDLERIRLIFMAAWRYKELFREYVHLEEIEQRIEKLAADVEMLKEVRGQKDELRGCLPRHFMNLERKWRWTRSLTNQAAKNFAKNLT